MRYLWRAIDALAICPVSGDEIHLVSGQHYRRVTETGRKIEISADEAETAIADYAATQANLDARREADDARRAAAAQAEAQGEQALAAAIRAAHPAATDAAIALFVTRYGSAWTVEPGYGLYDGYGDGADERIATLLADCA